MSTETRPTAAVRACTYPPRASNRPTINRIRVRVSRISRKSQEPCPPLPSPPLPYRCCHAVIRWRTGARACHPATEHPKFTLLACLRCLFSCPAVPGYFLFSVLRFVLVIFIDPGVIPRDALSTPGRYPAGLSYPGTT